MDMKQIQLTENEILEKEFKTSMHGYKQKEVDEFLDTVIQDYAAFQQEIERLQQKIGQLQQQTDKSRTRAQASNHQVNYDILKRLSNLEKTVFGGKKQVE